MPTATPYPSGLNLAWVINDYDPMLVAVDPLTQRIIHSVPITGLPVDIAIGGGLFGALKALEIRAAMWCASIRSATSLPPHPITTGEALSITAGYGSVWVGVAGEYGMNRHRTAR